MERQERNAKSTAVFLKNHPLVKKVYFAGLPEHKGYDILKEQARGFGGMLSFEVDSPETAERILKKVKLILFAESLGGVESLITYPMVQTHADVPVEQRERLGINDRLLRLSVGIENGDDIIADLKQALEV
jgi:cystathionine gamma-synthase